MKLPSELGPIHFIGIGGIGMSGIAEVLITLAYRVQGSDASDNASGDSLDVLRFGTGTTFKFHENAGDASGRLTLNDGTAFASITFLGNYTWAHFNANVGTTATSFTYN